VRLRACVAVGLFVLVLGVWSQPAAAAEAPIRILYAGDWAGSMELFAADPAGRVPVAQITFEQAASCQSPSACGFSRPLPSPDGRWLGYWSKEGSDFQAQRFFLARADGSGSRLVGYASAAAWSPDSRRLAYTTANGTHVLRGRHDRVVFPTTGNLLRYSPNGKTLALRTGSTLLLIRGRHARRLVTDADSGFAWSPDGRSIAYATRRGIELVTVASRHRRLLFRATQVDAFWLTRAEVAFSPRGRYLAFELGGIRMIDMRTHRVRATGAFGHDISWLPDGRLLYAEGNLNFSGDAISTGDVATVTARGRIRTVVSAAGPHGGQIVAAAWTVAARGVHYRAPQRVDGIFAGAPVQELAADGPRVAFISCGQVSVWNSQTGAVASVDARHECRASYSRGHVYSLGIAGDRVGWVEKGWGLCFTWQAYEATLGSPPLNLGTGGGCLGGTPPQGVGTFVGAGSLLVRSVWNLDYSISPPTVRSQTIERVDRDGCPCPAISSTPGPYTPLDVDSGRIVVSGANETRVLAADGSILLSLPVPTFAAQLDRSDLVLAAGPQLRDYDATTGAVRSAWPLPEQPAGHDCDYYGDPSCNQPIRLTIGDVSHGFVAYGYLGRVYLLRLSDGAVSVVGKGNLPRFTDAGLAFADGARIRAIPFDRLPLRRLDDARPWVN
jgi:WD40-like Beta Propeller Repeat